jgi:hypothetical protein
MNHSLRHADLETHLRIVTISLFAGIIVIIVALSARTESRIERAEIVTERFVMKVSRQSVHSATDSLFVR